MNDFHKKVFKNTKKNSKFAFKKGVLKKWKLFHFFSVVWWGARESRLAQTVNRKRPFTHRIENRPKPTPPPPCTVRFAVRGSLTIYIASFPVKNIDC